MSASFVHQPFGSKYRFSQSLCNDRCQNILYKSVFEHFTNLKSIAALLLASKSFHNSSFGANFLVNFVIDQDSIALFDSVLSPSSCFSLQFVPSLRIKHSWKHSDKFNPQISNFLREFVNTKYLPSSLRSLLMDSVTNEVAVIFFGSSSKAWPQLQELKLENCGLRDTVLELIAKNATQLRTACFSGCAGVTDTGLQQLSALSNMTFLNLRFCFDITDVGLTFISKLPHLSSLNLFYCDAITDTDLEHLSDLANLTALDLTSCKMITDAGLEHVARLPCITSLNLTGCIEITDSGIEHLSKNSGITALNLHGCGLITDSCIEHFVKMPALATLNLADCVRIASDGKAKLKNALPNCKISDSHGFL